MRFTLQLCVKMRRQRNRGFRYGRETSILDDIGELTKKYANLPESYIKRAAEQVEWKTPDLPQYLPRVVKKSIYRFEMDRPWTDEFRQLNKGEQHPEWVEPIKDWSIFKGDRVELLIGKDKGKQGLVSQVIQERNWVIVTGLNGILKRVGATGNFPGVMIREEQPLFVTTDVALVDPSDKKPTKISWRFTEAGERVRVSLRTGRVIPVPQAAEETIDYKSKDTYLEGAKDTVAKVVEEPSFIPQLKTFEMDIMDSMGIVETRVPKKSYWY